MFSVKDHFLVPKHYLLPKEQADEILKKFFVKEDQLPRISKADPAIKDFKAKKGDVIKIIRKSQTAGKTVYYRIVI